MDADWSVACGAEDPALVLPWVTADGSLHYVDLRADPSAINNIAEARRYASIAAALRQWNQPGSPIFTAKCDVWNYAAELFDAEDLPGFPCAQACYIDLLPSDPAIFSDFSACERQLRHWTDLARRIDRDECRSEWTLRPARIVTLAPTAIHASPADEYVDGFASSLYVWGYGRSPQAAETIWEGALAALIDPVLQSVRP